MNPHLQIRQVRAVYTESAIRIYQAYSDGIADTALERGRFVSPPFSRERMTWIKPSFLWMMCRAGWGKKEEKQKRILAIDITREGLDWALERGRLTHPEPEYSSAESSCVLIQWDPERDIRCHRLVHRSIQIGLRGEAVARYVDEWIIGISDITPLAGRIHDLMTQGDADTAAELLPQEREYPVSPEVRRRLGMTAANVAL